MFRVLLLTLLVAGCAQTQTSEEREYRYQEDVMKWERCQEIYRHHGKPTISRHPHGGRHWPAEVREDLWLNNCFQILKRTGWD